MTEGAPGHGVRKKKSRKMHFFDKMSIKRQVTDGRGTSSAFAPSCKKDFFEVVQGQICAHLFPNHNFLWSNEFFVPVSSPEWQLRFFLVYFFRAAGGRAEPPDMIFFLALNPRPFSKTVLDLGQAKWIFLALDP